MMQQQFVAMESNADRAIYHRANAVGYQPWTFSYVITGYIGLCIDLSVEGISHSLCTKWHPIPYTSFDQGPAQK